MKKSIKTIFQHSSKNLSVIKHNNYELERVIGGKKESSIENIPNSYKNRLAVAIDSFLTTTGAIIGAVSGISTSYSRTYKNGHIKSSNWQFKSPSVGAMMLYSGAGGIIGHKLANIICDKLIY